MSSNYKFPVWKVILFVSLFVFDYFMFETLHNAFHPTFASTLAVDQLNNSEASAIAIRVYEQLQNFLHPLSPFGAVFYIAFGLILFRSDLLRLRKSQ